MDNKQELVISAIKTRLSIIKGMGYASAIGYCTSILILLASTGVYLFDTNLFAKPLNGYAILGMLAICALTIITASVCSHQALEG